MVFWPPGCIDLRCNVMSRGGPPIRPEPPDLLAGGLWSLVHDERRRGGQRPPGMPERRRARARGGLLAGGLLTRLAQHE